jgi:hypothetical protein
MIGCPTPTVDPAAGRTLTTVTSADGVGTAATPTAVDADSVIVAAASKTMADRSTRRKIAIPSKDPNHRW